MTKKYKNILEVLSILEDKDALNGLRKPGKISISIDFEASRMHTEFILSTIQNTVHQVLAQWSSSGGYNVDVEAETGHTDNPDKY